VDVRVCAGEGVPTVLAGTARAQPIAATDDALAEPERQALLADTARALEQDRSWQRVASERFIEARAQRSVSVDGK
jgi:hypothetical protein